MAISVRSGPGGPFRRSNSLSTAVALVLLVCLCLARFPAAAQEGEVLPLHLEVYINDQPTRLIAAFLQSADSGISSKAKELRELGLKPPDGSDDDADVKLSDIEGLSYRYDEDAQILHITVDNQQRITKRHDARFGGDPLEAARTDPGLVMNYGLFAAASEDRNSRNVVAFDGASLSLDARAFSNYGTLSSSGIVSTEDGKNAEILRLQTRYTYSDPKAVRTYTIGDSISGGLNWSRPVRFGGVQIQSNFGLRPDLLTVPLPSVSGSAAVPSTVDVYVGNVKAHSQEVEAGPFEINNIPTVSGAGVARVVVKDATGRESETTSAFYAASSLLRKGLHDFSAEIGTTRRNFGEKSNDYSGDVFASASSRYGLTDTLTVEAHAEVMEGLINGGVGYVTPIANRLLVSGAIAASHAKGHKDGLMLYGSLDTQFAGLSIHASSRRTFGEYQDLASITGLRDASANGMTAQLSGIEVPTAFDQLALGLPIPSIAAGLNLSLIHIDAVNADPTYALSGTYSQSFLDRYSFYATVFSDLDDLGVPSITAGLSIALGAWGSASSGVGYNRNGTNYTASYTKPLDQAPGSFGWRLRNSEGETSNRFGALSYRGSAATGEATVSQVDGAFQGTGFAEGAVAIVGGGIFLSNRIDDAFAVVDTGAPDVPVRVGNRPRGVTGSDGKVLVPGLHSYERNRIQIDVDDLPVNAHIPETTKFVVPAAQAGVHVKFNVETEAKSAVVILTDASGKHLPVGSVGTIEGRDEEFVIGYDGVAFMKQLDATNSVVVELAEGTCTARFEFQPSPDTQVEIGPVACH